MFFYEVDGAGSGRLSFGATATSGRGATRNPVGIPEKAANRFMTGIPIFIGMTTQQLLPRVDIWQKSL